MKSNNLRSAVASITQNKRVRAIALEVIGMRASVKISGSSQVLYGIPITGGNIVAGQEVYVDYTTGTPVVHSYTDDSSTSSTVSRTKVRTIIPDPDIPSSSSNFIEAPIDDKTYGRKNAGWSEITSGSGTSGSGVSDHTQLTNIGVNTHAQIDTALTRLANTSGSNTGDQTLSGLGGLAKSDFDDIQRFGFLNQTETTISFDGTNTFTLGDAGSGWSYWRSGLKYTISGNKTIDLTTVESPLVNGHLYYIYIDSTDGTLSASLAPWNLNDTKVPVAVLAWNNSLTPKYQLSEERHTCLIDRRIHRYEHLTSGTKLISGGTISGQTTNTDTDAAKTCAISEAVIADEDIFLTLTSGSDPDGTTTPYVIGYKSGGIWNWEYSAMPFRYTASGYIQYNTSGSMVEGKENKYYNTYLALCNIQGNARFIILHGQSEFANADLAYAETPGTFNLSGIFTNELVVIYKFTWETKNSYSSKGKCVLNKVQNITTNIVTTTMSAIGDHNSLAGIQGGSTGEYYHLTAAQLALIGTSGSGTTSGSGIEEAPIDGKEYVRKDAGWVEHTSGSQTSGSGVDNFLDLSDTPNSYSGQASKVVSVKSDETGLEFTTVSSGEVPAALKIYLYNTFK